MTYVFDDTRALARRLADAGFGGHAEQLLAATSQGATGTEIFMILRSRLSNVIDDETVPPVHKSDAEGLREIVAHALKQ
jgi:hypothetical protein